MIAIIDSDVLAYMATYDVWVDVYKDLGLSTDTSKNIMLDADGKRSRIFLTKDQEIKYLKKSLIVFKVLLRQLLESVFCEEYLSAVKGPDNYRTLLYPNYKVNRHQGDPSKINILVPLIRKLAVHEGLAVEAVGCEADDLMRMWALQAQEAGDPYIICTIDKDLKCIEGKHFNMKTKQFFEVTKEQARLNYYAQLIQGDATDNIPGIPGKGPIKSRGMLSACTSEEEMQEVVVSAYIEFYGDDWYNYFLSNAKMIHLQRYPNDYFKAEEWPILLELR